MFASCSLTQYQMPTYSLNEQDNCALAPTLQPKVVFVDAATHCVIYYFWYRKLKVL